jgi:hypothetical protein
MIHGSATGGANCNSTRHAMIGPKIPRYRTAARLCQACGE